MINIITTFYSFTNKERIDELIFSINKNLESEYVESIHIFFDSEDCKKLLKERINSDKIVCASVGGRRATYKDFFDYTYNLEGKVCMISNSDVWIHSISDFLQNLIFKSSHFTKTLALTRHEIDMTKPFIDKYEGSHDAFVFKSPLPKLNTDVLNHYQSVGGSENVVIYELGRAGIEMINPCEEFIIVHQHDRKPEDHPYYRVDVARKGYVKPTFF